MERFETGSIEILIGRIMMSLYLGEELMPEIGEVVGSKTIRNSIYKISILNQSPIQELAIIIA
jgi:hypothetical protein